MKPITTRTGRVVYRRKKHVFQVKDLSNIAIGIVNNRTQDELYSQAIAIQGLMGIIREGLWPYWLDSSGAPPPPIGEAGTQSYWNEFFMNVWKVKTQHIADEWGEEIGVPARIREWIIDWLFDYIWDAIWKLTDPWFSYQERRSYGKKGS